MLLNYGPFSRRGRSEFLFIFDPLCLQGIPATVQTTMVRHLDIRRAWWMSRSSIRTRNGAVEVREFYFRLSAACSADDHFARRVKACDQCRKTKSKCKRNPNPARPCASCEASGGGTSMSFLSQRPYGSNETKSPSECTFLGIVLHRATPDQLSMASQAQVSSVVHQKATFTL